jgi:predicted kinase
MSYYVIIRGPLGVGKSTVSERLAHAIGAQHISIDRILDEPGVEEWDEEAGHYSERSFFRTNDLAVERTKAFLYRGTPVIFDGNFYWKSQIANLVARLNFPHLVFTLKAPLDLCVQRDSQRDPPHGREATEQVYRKSTEFDSGVGIDATQPVDSVVREIVSHLSHIVGQSKR